MSSPKPPFWNIDRALREWPDAEQGSPSGHKTLEWEDIAHRAAPRSALASGASDADVLRAPLPSRIGEWHRGIGPWGRALGALVAVAAVAAGLFAAVPWAARRPPGNAQLAPVPAAVAPPVAGLPARQAPVDVALDVPGVAPSDLPKARLAVEAPSSSGRSVASAKGVQHGPPAATGPGPGRWEEGLRPAAAPLSSPSSGVDGVPRKPSPGAVRSALGEVGPAARACLAPGDPPSYATVTFRSSGSVTDVTVSSPPRGTAQEGCIRSALLAARVAPFVDPSFGAPMTVRATVRAGAN